MKSLYLAVMLALVALCEASHSQIFPDENYAVFRDIDAVDTRVIINGREIGGERHSQSSLEEAAQAFDVTVMREGMTVSNNASNYLICNITAHGSALDEGYYFHISLLFFDFEPDGVHKLLYSAERGGFTPSSKAFDEFGQKCGEQFSYAYLKAMTESD